LRKIKLIGTGSSHSFAVDHKGVVYAWGLNLDRQTGITPSPSPEGKEDGMEDEHQDIIWEPTEVTSLHPKVLGLNRRVVEISGGEFHTLFRISDGSVYACGRCDDHQLGFGPDHPSMKEKKAKEDTLMQAKVEEIEEERRKVEKRRRKSDLANGKPPSDSSDPIQTSSTTVPPITIAHINKPALITFPCGDTITSISANGRHNLALSSSGEVFSWGLGLSSQLGLGKDPGTGEAIEEAAEPRKVESKAMLGWKVVDISAGGQHCVLLARREECKEA
jgi:regulator of chromosome condensation